MISDSKFKQLLLAGKLTAVSEHDQTSDESSQFQPMFHIILHVRVYLKTENRKYQDDARDSNPFVRIPPEKNRGTREA